MGQKFYAYVFVSSTWVLLVLAWFLGFEPYGPFLLAREANQLAAIMMSLPVIVAFLFSIKHLLGNYSNSI
jgi:cytochrome b subunit of formate dehydrogenase